tara:strand:+ start:167 stop:334 length:168 start_codon:yes stop_codon:yes gene_type:complete
MILKSIISGLCILAVVYGIAVKSRIYFNIGYFVFGIFPLAPAYFILFDEIEIVDK